MTTLAASNSIAGNEQALLDAYRDANLDEIIPKLARDPRVMQRKELRP